MHTEPIHIWHDVDAHRVVPARLSEGTAAQVVRAYGDYEVQISSILAPSLWLVVAQHAMARHPGGCYSAYCLQARGWLPAPPLEAVAGA